VGSGAFASHPKEDGGLTEVGKAILFLAILIGGCAIGMWLQSRLKEHHKSQETLDSIRMVIAMIVTFSALVLGLLVTSVKSDFDDHNAAYQRYGTLLVELDQRLAAYGPQAGTIRQQLRSFTAAVLADTWPTERRPAGSYPVNLHIAAPGSDESAELTSMLVQLDAAIQSLPAADAGHQTIESILQTEIRQIETERWMLVERSHSQLSAIFMGVLVSWLFIVFVIFGIVSPCNGLTLVVIGLSAIAVASSLYLILDLDTSAGGFIVVSSQPLRDALWHMDHDHSL
jgi:hypothetical protein